jgi:hypothetical protein
MMDNISTNINKPTKDHPSSKPLTGGDGNPCPVLGLTHNMWWGKTGRGEGIPL